MYKIETLCVLTPAVMLCAPLALAESNLMGQATAVAGDALQISGRTVRLSGIDAPAPETLCEGKITRWPCGAHSRAALAKLIDDAEVECRTEPPDETLVLRGTCRLAGADVGESQLRKGWARTTHESPRTYVAAQRAAREERRGLWRNE